MKLDDQLPEFKVQKYSKNILSLSDESKLNRAQRLITRLWDMVSAEIEILLKVPVHNNERRKFIEKRAISHAMG